MSVGRVLVVDDEPDHCTTLQAILERGAVTVSVAANCEEALRAAAAQSFQVAIVDLRMPGRDGLATMHALRRLQPALAVIILTAYPSPTTCRIALTEGAAAYFEKPYHPDELRALVQSLIAPPPALPPAAPSAAT